MLVWGRGKARNSGEGGLRGVTGSKLLESSALSRERGDGVRWGLVQWLETTCFWAGRYDINVSMIYRFIEEN